MQKTLTVTVCYWEHSDTVELEPHMKPPTYMIDGQGRVTLTCGLCHREILWSRSVPGVNHTIKISYWKEVKTPVFTGTTGASGFVENQGYAGDQTRWIKAIRTVDCCTACYAPFLLKTDPIIERVRR